MPATALQQKFVVGICGQSSGVSPASLWSRMLDATGKVAKFSRFVSLKYSFDARGDGIDAKLFDWSDEITADCPQAKDFYDQCGARCPDLSKVV
jgi:hypothetical protein